METKTTAEISREYKFGSVEWQNAMLDDVAAKREAGVPLNGEDEGE